MLLYLFLACAPIPNSLTCDVQTSQGKARLSNVTVYDMEGKAIRPTPELVIKGCPQGTGWQTCTDPQVTLRVKNTSIEGECLVTKLEAPEPAIPTITRTTKLGGDSLIRTYDKETHATCYSPKGGGVWCFCPEKGCIPAEE